MHAARDVRRNRWSKLLSFFRRQRIPFTIGNPISLVESTGATRRVRKARSLTAEQFQALLKELHEPFAMMALLCVCLILRISEALALRWADLIWLDSKLDVQRGIVEQVVADVKTEGSAMTFNLTGELLGRLKTWKQRTDFPEADDWIFASPIKLGRLPYSYTGVWRELQRAAEGLESRASRDPLVPAHSRFMAWRRGNVCRGSAEDDATHGNSNHHEHRR